MSDNQLKNIDQMINELDGIGRNLESGNLPLDQAIEEYSKGMRLAVECRKALQEMSRRVEILKQEAFDQISNIEGSAPNNEVHTRTIENPQELNQYVNQNINQGHSDPF